MKKIVSFVFTILVIFNLFAATKTPTIGNAEQTYHKGLVSFDQQDYGKALKYAEDAILFRKQKVEQEIETLKNALSPKRVQAAGENIEVVLKVLNERGEKETIKIINKYLKIKGSDFFENSISNLVTYIRGTEVYPEAQKLIGDIYKLEGEYSIAESYYKMALDNKDYLDIPDDKYEILYMLADISRLQDNDSQYEIRLLNILTEDTDFADKALKNAILRTIKQNKEDGPEKLFTLYRANNYFSLNAYSQLAELYYKNGETDKALTFSALFAITSYTKIYDTIKLRNFDYEYESLGSFFQEVSYHQDIVNWGSDNSIWKSFNVLARYCTDFGYTTFSKSLLRTLVLYSPERYWQQEAVLQLQKMDPQLD